MKEPYQIVITADGSPTVNWSKTEDASEHMHHSGGALSESLYIYHQALLELKARGWSARVFSLGLGLGYNELIALAEFKQNCKIWSYEAIPFLRESFENWLHSQPSELSSTYDQVESLVAQKFNLKPGELKALALSALLEGRLEIRSAYPEDRAGMEQISCVFYDAYSKKMNPELWDESTIVANLKPALAPNAVFATYAAVGALNRALKQLGFELQKKSGFAQKRESTLAIRVHQ